MSKNSWVSFIKNYAEKNNMKYSEALKNKEAKLQYNKLKSESNIYKK